MNVTPFNPRTYNGWGWGWGLDNSLASHRDCTGIKIVRYDFSDPQAGKDLCDRRIATVQSHVRYNINEGYDIKSASDIQWRVEGCQA